MLSVLQGLGFVGCPAAKVGDVGPVVLLNEVAGVEDGGDDLAVVQDDVGGIHVGGFGGNQVVVLFGGKFVDFAGDGNAAFINLVDGGVPAVCGGVEAIEGAGVGSADEFSGLQILVIRLSPECRATDKHPFGI